MKCNACDLDLTPVEGEEEPEVFRDHDVDGAPYCSDCFNCTLTAHREVAESAAEDRHQEARFGL